MSILSYAISKPNVQRRLPGTPHIHGGKQAVARVRNSLRELVVVLADEGWAEAHPLGPDRVALDAIELLDSFDDAELHAARIALGILARIAAVNGYYDASSKPGAEQLGPLT